MKCDILAEPILVGRESELKELKKILKATLEGKGNTVFVSGEAGSGKTRLTNEFLNYAKDKGITVLSGWCLSNAAVPYFPFVEAFDSYSLTNEDQNRSVGGQQLRAKTWLVSQDGSQAHFASSMER